MHVQAFYGKKTLENDDLTSQESKTPPGPKLNFTKSTRTPPNQDHILEIYLERVTEEITNLIVNKGTILVPMKEKHSVSLKETTALSSNLLIKVELWSFWIRKITSLRVCGNLKVLATIPYFNFHFFQHLLIFLQFRDPSCVLNISTQAVLQKWHYQCKRAKYLHFELIFRRA